MLGAAILNKSLGLRFLMEVSFSSAAVNMASDLYVGCPCLNFFNKEIRKHRAPRDSEEINPFVNFYSCSSELGRFAPSDTSEHPFVKINSLIS